MARTKIIIGRKFSSTRSIASKALKVSKTPIKMACAFVADRSPKFKEFYHGAKIKKRYRIFRKYANLPIDNKLVTFESFMGRKYADSPKAIYECMLKDPEFKDYRFVWFFREGVMDEYLYLEKNGRTSVVRWASPEYYKTYATAAYWFTNSRIPSAIFPREGQHYVQCWHGTPLKRLGFDIEVSASDARNDAAMVREMYEFDARRYTYMISPSAYCSEKFASAFNLNAIGKGDIMIEEGYPRNDAIVNHTQEDIDRIRESLGIDKDKKVVLYAPTWRESQHEDGTGYLFESPIDFKKMKESLGEDYVVLFRAHYFVANAFDFEEHKGFVVDVCNYPEINDLYIASDILITDYSSVFFDFGILKRPEIFYMYDLKYYKDELRGFYISLDELPGPIVEEEADLFEAIKNADKWMVEKEFREKYDRFTAKFTYLDDGHAAERVVNRIFKQKVK